MSPLRRPRPFSPRIVAGARTRHSSKGYMMGSVLFGAVRFERARKFLTEVKAAAGRLPYALTSLGENPFTLAVSVFYALLFLSVAIDSLLSSLGAVYGTLDPLFTAVLILLIISLLLLRVRNSSGYVEYLARLAGASARHSESLVGRLPSFRAHAKAIERIGNRSTMNHFDAMIRVAQQAKGVAPDKTLSYRQIAYGIELGMVREHQRLPLSEAGAPFISYRDRYDDAFHGKQIRPGKWADFLIAIYENQSPEVKARAEAKTEFSFMERVEKHIGFWTILLAIIAIVLGAAVPILS